MTSPVDVEQRLRAANVAPVTSEKPDSAWSAATLLEKIDDRAGAPEELARTLPRLAPRPDGPRRRGSAVAIGAALAVLVPVLALMLFLRGSSTESDIATTTPPPTTVPQPIQTDASDVPFYARFPDGEILHDEHWAVIVFHRPPECVPPAANLLVTSAELAPEDCGPTTVEGMATWDTGPDVDPTPTEVTYTGRGEVPVWLVPWPIVEQLAADGVLTRRELISAQTRRTATATWYVERSGPEGFTMDGNGLFDDGSPVLFSAERDGTDVRTTVDLLSPWEPVAAEGLIGAWQSPYYWIEFFEDGTLFIAYTRSSAYANAGPPPPVEELRDGVAGLFYSEGSFEVTSGVVTIVSTEGTHCAGTGSPGVYFAEINGAGQLTLDLIDDDCGRAGGQFTRSE